MTYADVINAREALTALYEARTDGATALAIRRVARAVETVLQDYDAAIRAWASREDVAGKRVSELSEEQQKYWSEMVAAEVESDWTPLDGHVLDEVQLSASEVDALIRAGVVDVDEG